MTAPVSLFVWMDRPLTQEEQARVREHVEAWRPKLARGASGYNLEPVQLSVPVAESATRPDGNGHRQPPTEPDARTFQKLMRQANLRTLVEQALALRNPGRRPTPAEIDDAFRTGSLRYVARLQPGPNFAHDVLFLVDAAKELEAILPDAEVRLHDGQLLRNVDPVSVDRAALKQHLGL